MGIVYVIIRSRDTIYHFSLLLRRMRERPTGRGQSSREAVKDQKEVPGMSKYELCVVLNAKIEDDERAAVIEKIKKYIDRFGGAVTNVDEWGKKHLAYEVQKMREGFYYFIQFDAETTTPLEIENRVRIMDNVLRYLCVKAEA